MNYAIIALISLAASYLIASHYLIPTGKRRVSQKSSPPCFEVFVRWMDSHGKSYATPNELSYRYNVFMTNYRYVKRSNCGEGCTLGLNLFSDLTNEEFENKYLGIISNRKVEIRNAEKEADSGPVNISSPSVNWVKAGVVNAIKDQRDCGSGWAFSAVSSFESNANINGYKLYDLSEQELVDCSSFEGNRGCEGGRMDYGFKYIIANRGIQGTASYPYAGVDQLCKANQKLVAPPRLLTYTSLLQSCDSLIASIAKGPLSIGISANAIQFYTGGIFSNKFCGTNINHGVNLVGIDYDNLVRKDYWLVRNSWGVQWGEYGYIRLDRSVQTSTGICGICMDASVPVISKQSQLLNNSISA